MRVEFTKRMHLCYAGSQDTQDESLYMVFCGSWESQGATSLLRSREQCSRVMSEIIKRFLV
jgi:hypothetical protein